MNQEQFITKIIETETVWILEKEESYATATSLNYDDDEGEPAEVLCFWSDEKFALACAKDDWEGYTPVDIPLTDFIENWCIGMDNDLIMAGVDFDEELMGDEADPLELIIEIGEALQKQDKKLILPSSRTMEDLVKEVIKILEA